MIWGTGVWLIEAVIDIKVILWHVNNYDSFGRARNDFVRCYVYFFFFTACVCVFSSLALKLVLYELF